MSVFCNTNCCAQMLWVFLDALSWKARLQAALCVFGTAFWLDWSEIPTKHHTQPEIQYHHIYTIGMSAATVIGCFLVCSCLALLFYDFQFFAFRLLEELRPLSISHSFLSSPHQLQLSHLFLQFCSVFFSCSPDSVTLVLWCSIWIVNEIEKLYLPSLDYIQQVVRQT